MYLISPTFPDLMAPNIEIKLFPDGDSYVRINDMDKCQGEDVVLFHRLYPKQNSAIFNVAQMLHTLKRVGARVTLVAPYLPYARQDKTFLMGESLSAQVLCKLLADFGTVKLVTVDCHFLKKEGESEYSNLKIHNISAGRLLVEHARMKLGLEHLEVISPDQGANYLVSEFGGKSMNKVRGAYDAGNGTEAYRSVQKVEREFEVEGKNILILDDMISTGGTMLKAVENVKKGGAKKVICAATHGFFLNESLTKLKKVADGVFTTNSIPNEAAEVDINPLLRAVMPEKS
ncbi:ribose-phosphate diphosphokinase [Candidatus Micrarchaeota archaeon]|nr:ribose-phosphate diphosphokinase [Candidatus Micrarchaeota archaeon]